MYQMKLSSDGLTIVEETIHLDNLGRIRDICVNPNNGTIYIIDNGTRYPGTIPNSIIEYKPLGVGSDEVENVFVDVSYDNIRKEICVASKNAQMLDRYEVITVSGQKLLGGTRNQE